MLPIGSVTGMSAPIAAAIGSSIKINFRRARVRGGVADRAALDLGRSRGDADHDLGPAHRRLAAAVDLADEMLDHVLGDVDVGDHAIAKRADRLDRAGGLAHHQLGVVAHRDDALDAVDRLDRDDRRFVEDDAATADVDDGVRRPEIDRHIVRHEFEETREEHISSRRAPLDAGAVRTYIPRRPPVASPGSGRHVCGVAGCRRLV